MAVFVTPGRGTNTTNRTHGPGRNGPATPPPALHRRRHGERPKSAPDRNIANSTFQMISGKYAHLSEERRQRDVEQRGREDAADLFQCLRGFGLGLTGSDP